MRIIKYLFLTIIIVLGFTFACLNAATVNINYYIGSSIMPLSLLLVITLIVGMIAGILCSLGWVFRLKRKARRYHQQIKQLQQEVVQAKNMPIELSEI